jgi:hypothetical protein
MLQEYAEYKMSVISLPVLSYFMNELCLFTPSYIVVNLIVITGTGGGSCKTQIVYE